MKKAILLMFAFSLFTSCSVLKPYPLEENGFLKSEKVGKEKLYLNEQLLKILEGKAN